VFRSSAKVLRRSAVRAVGPAMGQITSGSLSMPGRRSRAARGHQGWSCPGPGPGAVLVDHRGARAGVAEPRHEFLGGCLGQEDEVSLSSASLRRRCVTNDAKFIADRTSRQHPASTSPMFPPSARTNVISVRPTTPNQIPPIKPCRGVRAASHHRRRSVMFTISPPVPEVNDAAGLMSTEA
jgi:hypothetical protein